MRKDNTQTPVTPATDAQIQDMEFVISRYAPKDISWTTADILALIARIRASEPVWQDIATAPRDGTWILAVIWFQMTVDLDDGTENFPEYIAVQWDELEGAGWLDQSAFLIDDAPTHWQPLPSPPKPLSYEGEQS